MRIGPPACVSLAHGKELFASAATVQRARRRRNRQFGWASIRRRVARKIGSGPGRSNGRTAGSTARISADRTMSRAAGRAMSATAGKTGAAQRPESGTEQPRPLKRQQRISEPNAETAIECVGKAAASLPFRDDTRCFCANWWRKCARCGIFMHTSGWCTGAQA